MSDQGEDREGRNKHEAEKDADIKGSGEERKDREERSDRDRGRERSRSRSNDGGNHEHKSGEGVSLLVRNLPYSIHIEDLRDDFSRCDLYLYGSKSLPGHRCGSTINMGAHFPIPLPSNSNSCPHAIASELYVTSTSRRTLILGT